MPPREIELRHGPCSGFAFERDRGGRFLGLGDERDEVFAVGVKITARHGEDFLRGDGLDMLVVAGAEVGIALIKPAASERGGLARHGFLAVDLMEKALALGAVEFALAAGASSWKTSNLAADFREKGFFLIGRATGLDAPEAVIGGRVGEGIELLGEAELFHAALVQARTAAAAGQRGEEIERGRVGVVESADGPAERDAAELRGEFAAQFPALVLARLVREIRDRPSCGADIFRAVPRRGRRWFRARPRRRRSG